MHQIETKEISFFLNNANPNSSIKYTPIKLNSFKAHSTTTSASVTKRSTQSKKLPQLSHPNLFDRYKSTPSLSKDEFIQKYLIKKRKKSMIISKYLDEDLRKRLETLKYKSFKPTETIQTTNNIHNETHTHDDDYYDDFYEHHHQQISDLNYVEPSSILIQTSASSSTDSLSNNLITKKNKTITNSNLDMTKSKTLSFKPTNETNNDVLSQKQKLKSIRFGSTLSRDGQYALLKSLEDEIVQELHSVYPDMESNQIPRISTANYKKMMNRRNSKNKSMIISNKNETMNNLIDLENKINVTRSIESGMEILDLLRMKKKLTEQMQMNCNEDDGVSLKSLLNRNDFDLDKEYLELRNFKMKQASFVTSFHTVNNAIIDPFKKYTEWCNDWITQLENL